MRVYSVVSNEDCEVHVYSDVLELVLALPEISSDEAYSTKRNPRKGQRADKLAAAIVANAEAGKPTELYSPGGGAPELTVRAHEV